MILVNILYKNNSTFAYLSPEKVEEAMKNGWSLIKRTVVDHHDEVIVLSKQD